MSTDLSSPQPFTQSDQSRTKRYWPAWAITGLGLAAVAYLQIVGVVDSGTSNGFTIVAVLVTLILLGLWTAFLAPFARSTRWRILLAAAAVLVAAAALVRVKDFDGSLKAHLTWRWTPKPDVVLAARPLEQSAREIDVRPTTHDFAGFLGSNRDAYVPDVRLATNWSTRPRKLRWKQPIGGGYSAFAVVGQAAFTLEQRDQEELVTCYDVNTGALAWHHAIQARHHNQIGGDGPSSTPTIHDGRVYALGGTGVLRCLDAATGKEIWIRDVLADVGTNYEADSSGVWWGRAASPLIVDDLVVVPGGGPPAGPKVSLVAYNQATGAIVWKGGARQVSYSSPSLANYGGVRQIVIVNEATITGHNPRTGDVLWEVKWDGSSNSSASVSQTVPVDDEHFFVSKGYSTGGGALFEIKHEKTDNGDGTFSEWSTKKLWHNHRVLMTKLDNVVIKDGSVYGLSDGILQCVDLKTGRKLWEGDEYGHGQLLRVGDRLLVTGEWGAVALVELNPNEFHELARFQAIDGKTWNNPAISGDLLVVRNAQEAACYELPLAD
jgi:outer membrane protein assembly factor BamB